MIKAERPRYDYLIVGAGLFGAVFARQATDAGKKCLVIDKRPQVGGNIYTERVEALTCTATARTYFTPTTGRSGSM